MRPRLSAAATLWAAVALGVALATASLSGCATRAAALPPPEPAPVAADPQPEPLAAPAFRVSSIRILRDLLVTTELRLGLEVENPNEVPLRLESLSWRLWAEGRPWASGEARIEAASPLLVPARGKAKVELDFEMNFADRDRQLLDLVAGLRTLRYRVSGEARFEAAGTASGGAFLAPFDEAGSCAVER